MNGELAPDPLNPSRALVVGNRHQGGMNSAFYDGHAKWFATTQVSASRDLTGFTSTGPNNLCNNPAFFPHTGE